MLAMSACRRHDERLSGAELRDETRRCHLRSLERIQARDVCATQEWLADDLPTRMIRHEQVAARRARVGAAPLTCARPDRLHRNRGGAHGQKPLSASILSETISGSVDARFSDRL